MTNVYQVTPDRQSKFRSSLLMVGEEKKHATDATWSKRVAVH